jgi:hypothetical protein
VELQWNTGQVDPLVYARHVEDPEPVAGSKIPSSSRGHEPFSPESFGFEPLGRELRVERLRVERLKAEGLMGCPFNPAQGKESPLYANLVVIVQ